MDELFSQHPDTSVNNNATLVINDRDRSAKVLTTLHRELRNCNSFNFSVAFITLGGIESLKQTLLDGEDHVSGRIITTDYLNFNDPKALRELLKFKNIKTRVYTKEQFHTKGYLFTNPDESVVLIGSSNLTQDALSTTKEWNIRITTKRDPAFVKSTQDEFERMWEDSEDLTEEWIREYEPKHIKSKIERDKQLYSEENYPGVVLPNKMQEEALQSLSRLRSEGNDRALLISATGTGKTYLSAFDVRETGFRKVLFLVHREQILDDALKSYQNVLGSGLRYGKISGTCRDYGADIIFSTIQSMSKPEVMKHFAPDHFEYIVCDEAHHSTSTTYDRILSYFKPKFMLGMTATPERMDGYDIFEKFNHNIAYEIRLQDALEQELLCPFHYYGVSEITVNGELLKDESDFRYLVSDERVKHIIEKAELYGHSGDRVKGLIFCSRKDEGRVISDKMNALGYRTRFICGEDPITVREDATNRLEQDENKGALDYIITVDVFNEGVDIRSINQIILLRPTESVTIFIQQLGRGLRKKAKDGTYKEFLVVLDFIGNYKNNYLIPMALTGDSSMSKETIRRKTMQPYSEIPGCSTVDFDPISRKRIFESISSANKGLSKLVRDTYLELTKMLGHAPDFRYLYDHNKIDPTVIADKYGNLNRFRGELKLDCVDMSPSQDCALTFVSQMFVDGKRPHELLILKELLENRKLDVEQFKTGIESLDIDYDDMSFESAVTVLSGKFNDKLKGDSLISVEKSKILPSTTLESCCDNPLIHKYFEDVIECGLERFKKEYSKTYDGLFTPFKRYSRSDVCRILDWNKDVSSTVYGYKVKDNSCPMFVTYHKSDDISESTQYEDAFIDRETFSWMSRSRRSLNSNEIKEILSPKCQSYLFVKKSDDESGEFYYLGRVSPIPEMVRETTITNKGEKLSIVNIPLKLESPVPTEIYNYLINE